MCMRFFNGQTNQFVACLPRLCISSIEFRLWDDPIKIIIVNCVQKKNFTEINKHKSFGMLNSHQNEFIAMLWILSIWFCGRKKKISYRGGNGVMGSSFHFVY